MKFNNKLFIIATIFVMTGAPLAVNASGDFIGYKCGEGNSPIAYQVTQCPYGVIEHKVLLIGKNLVVLIDSAEISAEETVSLQKTTADNMAVRKSVDKEIARINFEKEQADKQREAEIIAVNERANAQAQAQANQVELLNKMNKKLNMMRTQNIIDNNQQQQLYNSQQSQKLDHTVRLLNNY